MNEQWYPYIVSHRKRATSSNTFNIKVAKYANMKNGNYNTPKVNRNVFAKPLTYSIEKIPQQFQYHWLNSTMVTEENQAKPSIS